jgi:ribonucleoside-diphosphate reductase alpha chain
MPFPPHGERKRMPSVVSAMAQVIQYRVEQLGAFEKEGPTPVLDALFSLKEPKTGTDGTLSWTVDIYNPATGEDFVLGLKEITLPDGVTRPYSVWLSGNYPRALDGLTKLLSLDMRVLDPAWIGMKLRKLLDYPEPLGDFMAFVPGTRKQQNLPVDRRLHRATDHPPLRHARHPRRERLPAAADGHPRSAGAAAPPPKPTAGKLCGECGNHTMIRKDGCDFCTACGAVGVAGSLDSGRKVPLPGIIGGNTRARVIVQQAVAQIGVSRFTHYLIPQVQSEFDHCGTPEHSGGISG